MSNRTNRPFAALRTAVLAVAALLTVASATAQMPNGIAAADQSSLVGLKLPEGGFRITTPAQLEQFRNALAKMAEASKATVGDVELLMWQGTTAKDAFTQTLRQSGFTYTPQQVMKLEQGQITPFILVKSGQSEGVLGMWLEQQGNTMLAWGKTRTAGAAPSQGAAPAAVAGEASRLTGVALPQGFMRSEGAEQAQAVARNLTQLANGNGISGNVAAESVEMLVWRAQGGTARTTLYAALEKAGFERKDYAPLENGNGKFLLFSVKGKNGQTHFGMWIVQGDAAMLAWGRVGA